MRVEKVYKFFLKSNKKCTFEKIGKLEKSDWKSKVQLAKPVFSKGKKKMQKNW